MKLWEVCRLGMKKLFLMSTLLILGCTTGTSIQEPERFWFNSSLLEDIQTVAQLNQLSTLNKKEEALCKVEVYKIPLVRSCVIEVCPEDIGYARGVCLGRNDGCRKHGLNDAYQSRYEVMTSCMASKGYMYLSIDEFKSYYPLISEKLNKLNENKEVNPNPIESKSI